MDSLQKHFRYTWSFLRRMLAFLILPNIPIWAAPHFTTSVPRGIFNLDYLLLAIVSLYFPVGITIACFALLFSLDVFSITSAAYFFSQTDWIVSAQYLNHIPLSRLVRIATTLLLSGSALGALCQFLAGRPAPEERRRIAVLTSLAILPLLALGLIAGPLHGRTHDTMAKLHPMRSALSWIEGSLWRFASNPYQGSTSAAESASQVSGGWRDVSHPAAHVPNRVLVIVESYGQLNDPAAASGVQTPYRDAALQGRYAVETGMVDFIGGTVPAEFRELCGLRADLRTTVRAAELAPNCLPQMLQQAGYETSAYHGFSESMFNRMDWYRSIGFENLYFREQMEEQQSCAGPFPGVCDEAVGELIRKRLIGNARPQFVYWVTLNSHLPLASNAKILNELGCNQSAKDSDQALCIWRGLIEKVHAEVASIAMDPRLPPTEFVVVGDHSPPFLSPATRSQFSQTEVPYIHLVPHNPRVAPRALAGKRPDEHARVTHPHGSPMGTLALSVTD